MAIGSNSDDRTAKSLAKTNTSSTANCIHTVVELLAVRTICFSAAFKMQNLVNC